MGIVELLLLRHCYPTQYYDIIEDDIMDVNNTDLNKVTPSVQVNMSYMLMS